MRSLSWLAAVAAIVASLLLWSENRRLHAVAERREAALDKGRAQIERLRAVMAAADRAHDATVQRLESEAFAAFQTRDAIVATLDTRRDELTNLAREQRERVAQSTKPPPEGVRIALAQLNLRLQEDGHGALRFLHATELEDGALRNVEMIEYRSATFATLVWTAGEVRFDLDRERGTLTVLCRDGHVVGAGVDLALPPEGRPIELHRVDGRAWEESLPYLVRARGVYPVDERDVARRQPPSIDRSTALVWAERLDGLLAAAETEVQYRVAKLHDLREGVFRDVLLHGYGAGKRLEVSARVAELEVVIDDVRGGAVVLLLRNGELLRHDGTVQIGADGYRILLPGVEPKAARDAMLGLVNAR